MDVWMWAVARVLRKKRNVGSQMGVLEETRLCGCGQGVNIVEQMWISLN